jgi:transcriptional regulator with XRE-family HTH domain
VRDKQGISQRMLAERCTALGMPQLNKSVIANLEFGRRDHVSVDELYVFARALGVAPIHLLVPVDDREVSVTPEETRSSREVREWVAGQHDLDAPEVDDEFTVSFDGPYWREAPRDWLDLELFLERRYARILWTVLERARQADDSIDADEAERLLDEILGGR